jgi:hypothetical protein
MHEPSPSQAGTDDASAQSIAFVLRATVSADATFQDDAEFPVVPRLRVGLDLDPRGGRTLVR